MDSSIPTFSDKATSFSKATDDWKFDPFASSSLFDPIESSTFPSASFSTTDMPTEEILRLMDKDPRLAPLVCLYRAKLAPEMPPPQLNPFAAFLSTPTTKRSIFEAPSDERSSERSDDWVLPDPELDFVMKEQHPRPTIEPRPNSHLSAEPSGAYPPLATTNLFEDEDPSAKGTILLQSAVEDFASPFAVRKAGLGSSRTVTIGKDYLDHENRDVMCGQANGLAVMTQPNTGFETSLSQFLPLLSDVTEVLLSDLGLVSPSSSHRLSSTIPHWGAVCRSERSRVHYYLHCYDPLLPVLHVFERLILDPRLSRLEGIARVYPVTTAAHPDLDFAQVAHNLLVSHPRFKPSSKASSSVPPHLQASSSTDHSVELSKSATEAPKKWGSSDGLVPPPSVPASSSKGSSGLSQSTSGIQTHQQQQQPSYAKAQHGQQPSKITIGLAIESHRAADFAKELSAFILKRLPYIEIVERNPMSCDLMLSMCYFNSVFLIALWDPINANCLNNYRPIEMATWASLHPRYAPRVASATTKYAEHLRAMKKQLATAPFPAASASKASPIGSGRLALLSAESDLLQASSPSSSPTTAPRKNRASSSFGGSSKGSYKKNKRATH